jgi:hypothetical protein
MNAARTATKSNTKYQIIWQCNSCGGDAQITPETLDIDKTRQKGIVDWKVMGQDPTRMTRKKLDILNVLSSASTYTQFRSIAPNADLCA